MPLQYLQKGMDWRFGDTKHDSINGVPSVAPEEGGAGIQRALDVVNPNGTIELQEGTFDVSSTINLDNISGVTIRSDHDAVVRAVDSFDSQIFSNVNNAPVTSVTFEGFTIDGNAGNQTLSNASAYYGIGTLVGAEHITIQDMTIQNTANNALVFNDGDNHRIRNSRFYDSGRAGATKTAAHVVLNGGSGHVVENNEFGRATDNALYTRNDGTVVIGNRFSEVMMYLMDSGSHNQYYLYNDAVGAPKEPVAGTVMTNRRWLRFNKNDLTNIYIIGNTLRGLDAACAGFAEATVNTSTGHRNIHFWNNHIYGNGLADYGILWNSPIADFSVRNNLVAETVRDGIRVNGITRGAIEGNTSYNTNTSAATFVWPLALGRGADIPNRYVSVANNRSIDDRTPKTHYHGMAIRGNTGGGWINIHDNIVDGAVNAERDIDTGTPYLVHNGLGYNSGDPATAGQWTGEGYEGLRVLDTSVGGVVHTYAGGAWR